jgi:hypothetical protein
LAAASSNEVNAAAHLNQLQQSYVDVVASSAD